MGLKCFPRVPAGNSVETKLYLGNSTDLDNPVIKDIELIISQELVQFRHDYNRLQGLM